MRLLALDVGDVRIGVALSDETETLASGLVTLRSVGARKDAQAVAALVREHEVGEVVVGLPLRLDGSLGSRGEQVMAFVERLRRVLRVPVVTRDERLTSVAADERLAEASTASLAIVAVGLVPLIVAARRMVKPEAPTAP